MFGINIRDEYLIIDYIEPEPAVNAKTPEQRLLITEGLVKVVKRTSVPQIVSLSQFLRF